MQDRFLEKWERQRKTGRLVYGVKHAVIFSGTVASIAFVYQIIGIERPKNLTFQTVMLFAIGGFAYGLIRYRLRERFYTAMKGQIDD